MHDTHPPAPMRSTGRILGLSALIFLCSQACAQKTPPMGWNSFSCYGASVTEQEVKANADMMAAHLREYGWQYIVVDFCWFYPHSGAMGTPSQNSEYHPPLTMDEFGRLLPAVDKFPSAAGGNGFKPLADYVHGKGLKFGIHVMRGIPRQAYARNTPILGTNRTAGEIGNPASICSWLDLMYGVDCTREGAQQYYTSLVDLYAAWGVDYLKVDDISMPYRALEIEAVRQAIVQCGREIVLSLSPGPTPPEQAGHVVRYANLWRISADFWDYWDALKRQFEQCNIWSRHQTREHWPDADLLPIGRLNRRGPNQGLERESNFTEPEKRTLLTLWCIFRSPLMVGGDLTCLTTENKRLLTNKEVLEVNQNSLNNRQLFRTERHVAWSANAPGSKDVYLALFNIGESEDQIAVKLDELGLREECRAKDLWEGKETDPFSGIFTQRIVPHGAGLYRLHMN